MVKDSLESSHPINVEVNDPNEINSLFDDITYSKVKQRFLNIDVRNFLTNFLKQREQVLFE